MQHTTCRPMLQRFHSNQHLLPDDEATKLTTVGDAVKYIEAHMGKAEPAKPAKK